MNFTVYILLSTRCVKTYVGQTKDLEFRLKRHNLGRVRSTKANRPWKLLHSQSCTTRSEAMRQEKWYKSRAGRENISELIRALEGK